MNTPKLFLIIVLSSAIYSCTKVNESPFSNEVYLPTADTSQTVKVSLDTIETYYPLLIRAADIVDSDVQISLTSSEAVLDQYNKENGTAFKLLPQQNFAFSSTKAIIAQGSAIANPVSLVIRPFSNAEEGAQYAIPVTISSNQVAVSNASKTIIVLIDKVIYTSVPYLISGNATSLRATYKEPFEGLTKWTFEWRAKVDTLSSNNQALLSSYPDEVYTRFGDVVIKTDQLQVKTAGDQFSPLQSFQSKRWYHFALVYDGVNLLWYVDGDVVVNTPVTKTYNFKYINFGGGANIGRQVNEIRFWTTVRTPVQIVNNMYGVDPDSEGLAGYWKCNEGMGNVLKDYSKNGNDMLAGSNIRWEHKVRMPALN